MKSKTFIKYKHSIYTYNDLMLKINNLLKDAEHYYNNLNTSDFIVMKTHRSIFGFRTYEYEVHDWNKFVETISNDRMIHKCLVNPVYPSIKLEYSKSYNLLKSLSQQLKYNPYDLYLDNISFDTLREFNLI